MRVLPLLVGLLAPLCCQGGVYAHVDPVSGMTILNNVPPEGREPASRPAPVAHAQMAGFPRVTGARQRELDGGRRNILRTELSSEQQALSTAIAAQAAQDVVQRHVANIAALQRELAAMR
jgi:hypothetical protein